MEGEIKITIPSAAHRAELEAKGINIEDELTRIVYDHYVGLRDGNGMSSLTMKVTKKQIDTLDQLGVDGPKQISEEFRNELHQALDKMKKGEV